ncbi:LytTR family DNA-binding domain-containing protein [Winogradskyella sp.]|uniref:LytR/AlgR family response regulator transcription factor n=1 Tax=Winogradskyella sp. TaxID=1883156 RepID=UPI00261CBBBE|nr:LytTR family DNA-binding domain-containing protein [Winogradskyella sp.]
MISKTIIVEDEGPARRRLAKMVEAHPSLELITSLKSGQEAITQIPLHQPDLLLLDIQLKDKTAFDVLAHIQTSITSKIIFITAYDNYAIKAFEVEAIDYLLKPYDEVRFNTAISRVIKNNNPPLDATILNVLKKSLQGKNSKISIPEGNKTHLFLAKDIIYIQSDKYYVHVHTKAEKRLIRITLKRLEAILPKDFIRINKSVIINTQHISQIEYQKNSSRILLTNGGEFFSSMTYNKVLRLRVL